MTTKATMALAELSEKGADVDLLRAMVRQITQRLMDMDVESLCAAAYGERSVERANSRNGYRERNWDELTILGPHAPRSMKPIGSCP